MNQIEMFCPSLGLEFRAINNEWDLDAQLSLHWRLITKQTHYTSPSFDVTKCSKLDCSPRVMKLVHPSLISSIAKSPQTSDRLSITFSSFQFNGKLMYLYGSSETGKLEWLAQNDDRNISG